MDINNNNNNNICNNQGTLSSELLTNSRFNWYVDYNDAITYTSSPYHTLGITTSDYTNSRLNTLESILEDVILEINSIDNDIKNLSSEGNIKVYRIHKEGEKIGLLKIKKSLEDKISNLKDLHKV